MDFISIWYGNPAGGHSALVRALEGAFAVHPVATPEAATVDSNNSLTVDADATHGTLFFDLDNTNAPATITDFSTVAAELPKMYVRIAARYQQDGTLVATRIYARNSFDKIGENPEGRVLHVNINNNTTAWCRLLPPFLTNGGSFLPAWRNHAGERSN